MTKTARDYGRDASTVERYQVLLHGKGLLLLNQHGDPAGAGVYTWRVVEAETEEEAKKIASADLLRSKNFTDELWNQDYREIEIEIEEVSLCESPSAENSGFVYYFENAEYFPFGAPEDGPEE